MTEARTARPPRVDATSGALDAAADLPSQRASDPVRLGSWFADLRTGERSWSDGLHRLLGVEPGDAPATLATILERAHPDDRARLRRAVRDALAAGRESEPFEWRTVRPDGTVRTLRAAAGFGTDPGGGTTHFFGAVEDVTDRHRAEDVLRRRAEIEAMISRWSRRFLIQGSGDLDAAIVEGLADLAGTVEADGAAVVQRSEEHGLVMTHEWHDPTMAPPELPRDVARGSFLWMHGSLVRDEPVVLRAWEIPRDAVEEADAFRRSGALATASIPVVLDGNVGGIVVLLWRRTMPAVTADELSPLRVLGDIVLVGLERRRADEERRRTEERFGALVQHSSDLVVVLDADGTLSYVSPAVRRILGRDPEAHVGTSVFELLHPAERDSARAALAETVRTAGVKELLDVRVAHADGSWRKLEIVANNLLADPYVGAVVVNARDVTERLRLEEQLLQSQKMDAVGRLAGGIAHDFNNLLTAITGYTALLLEDLGPRDPRRPDLEEIDAAADRAKALVDQLLSFSRRKVVQPGTLDLNEVVTSMESLLRRLLPADIDLRTELAPGRPAVRADRSQLEQVVLNLVVNARDAMPDGGRLVVATRRTDPPEDRHEEVVLSVTDDGVGMDAETRQQIFEPFFTTKTRGRGTGLGLSTVYGIVTQAGGRIAVESAPGRGSAFHVHLPASRRAAVARAGAPRARDPGPRGHETVLVVEHDEHVRALVREVLARHGYSVLDVADPDRAWALVAASERPVDLLLSSAVLPGVSGPELARRLRAVHPRLEALFVSGAPNETAGEPLAPAEVLLKPFRPDQLVHRIREVLERRGR